MTEFKAMPTAQYIDQIDIKPVFFIASSLSDANHWVINHCDCSYRWVITAIGSANRGI